MTIQLKGRSHWRWPLPLWQLGLYGLLFLSAGLILRLYLLSSAPDNFYRYQLERPQRGQITQDLNREIAFYQSRLQQDPKGGLNRALLAHTYLKMARATGESNWYLLAEQSAQESLAHLPFTNDGALLALARISLAQHNFQRTIQVAHQVQDQSNALPVLASAYLAVGNLPAAQQAVAALVKQAPNLSALTLQALVNVAQGDDAAAIAGFKQAIALEEAREAGGSAYARTLLGRLYYKRGNLHHAEALYRESLRILPEYAPALLNLAELQIRQGNYAAATDTYNRFFFTTRKTPTTYDHTALRGIARLKQLQGRPQEAQQEQNRAEARLRQDMRTFGHRRELAQLLLDRGHPQDVKEALLLIQAEVKVRQDAETWSGLAKVRSQLGQWNAAAAAMQRALASGIRDAGLFQQMGIIQTHLGQPSQAQVYFQQAKQVDPTYDVQAQNAQGLGVGLLGLN